MSEKQVKTTFYLPAGKLEQLRRLSEQTRIKQADYFREAVDDLLQKYRDRLQEITATKTTTAKKRR